MALKHYLIAVDDEAGVPMSDLAERLRATGFVVAQQLEAIGVILGSADETALPRIREVHGVAAIDEERTIGPLSSD